MESTNFATTEMESISAPSTINQTESPPPYELAIMDLERGPSPRFERQNPLFDSIADAMGQQNSDANCSVVASLGVFTLREIGYEQFSPPSLSRSLF